MSDRPVRSEPPGRNWSPVRWGLRGRIAGALFAAGALVLGVVGASAVLMVKTRDAQQTVVTEYYTALKTSQDYLLGMIDSDTAVRGYALSNGDRAVLGPLQDAKQPWAHPISPHIARLLPGNAAALGRLRLVEQASADWYAQWAGPVIARVASGEHVSSRELQRGSALFDRVRTTYSAFIDQVRAERNTEAAHLFVLTNLLFDSTLAVALIAVLAGLLLWLLLRRWVSRPVLQLAKEAQVVTSGNLDHRVSVTGPLEFVQLGAEVEAMRERLVTQIAAVESTRLQVLDARVRLEDQAEELQRSNRELEQFAYVASHDLQEPLRKVASFCQLLQRRYADQLDDRANQYIHFAVDGARRMQQLINDLLDFSRVGRLSNPATDVDTAACFRMAVANVETSRLETGASVEAGQLPVVPGEAPLLTQLFQNLISNAIKFRTGETPVVRIGAERTGQGWEFWCTDNGIGIQAEYADRVFLIFQRLHAKEVYEGTGIGLAMCKKIVEYHGGRIWVDTSQQTGTTIRWTLPAEPGALAAPADAPAATDLVHSQGHR